MKVTETAVRAPARRTAGFTLTSAPEPLGAWLTELWRNREVTVVLARKDFQVRYKRATLGVLWAVAVPLLQAAVLAAVFYKIGRFGDTAFSYPVFVLGGVLAWGYFSSVLTSSSTAIVDAASLTDKVWFPRAVLAIVPSFSNLVGLAVSMVALLAALPLFGVPVRPRLLLLVPACVLLFAFTTALGLLLSALHVYFRDVRYLTTAGLLLWFYVTPIIYPASTLGRFGAWLDLNPMTGIADLFRLATIGSVEPSGRAITLSIAVTASILAIGLHTQRRHDRLFVDLL